ncbi:MAG: molybdopterin-dependent oxidoreductase [Deltaproteobacteria bacterium]|nr:molybdopterin-dependent oxidoreductase [Deltaproteobacteria bacterium]
MSNTRKDLETTTMTAGQGDLSRRSFLKWTGAGVGGLALTTIFPVPFRSLSAAETARLNDYLGGRWIPSCCNMCGGQCGIWAYVRGGIVEKIEPTTANPNALTDAVNPNNVANVDAPKTRLAGGFAASGRDAAPTGTFSAVAATDVGRLCCKGNSGMKSLYDPDRVKTPMKRVGPRGSGQFVPISWDQAIEETSRRLTTLKQQYGARSVVWFGEDHSFTHPQQDFCDAFGSPNYSNHANLCDTSRKAHYKATIGDERPLADMENCDVLFVWGWNFLSALKWIHLAAIFSRGRRDRNFKFIYVDPVFNTTASRADDWVPLRPGTDGALALAIAKELVDYDAGTGTKIDKAWMDQWAVGFTEYKKYLDGDGTYDAQPKNAAWGEAQTGVAAARITALARELGDAFAAGKRICIDTWSGGGHHTNATQGGRAINCLNLLLGGVDRPGTLLRPNRSGPARLSAHASWKNANGTIKYDGWRPDGRDDITLPEPAVSNRTLVDTTGTTWTAGTTVPAGTKFHKKYAFSHGSGIYVEMRERMLEQRDHLGFPYPMKAAVIVFQNLLMSTPNTQRNIQALEAMDFIVCVDTHLSETAQYADILIPGSSYLERFDFNASWVTFFTTGLRQPVVPSWIGGRSEAQFFLDLGRHMGFTGFDAANFRDVDENLNKKEWDTARAGYTNNVDWPTLKQKGVWIETGASRGGTFYHKYATTYSALNKYSSAWMHVYVNGTTNEVRTGTTAGAGGVLIGTVASATPAANAAITLDASLGAGTGFRGAVMDVVAVTYGGDQRYVVRGKGTSVNLGIAPPGATDVSPPADGTNFFTGFGTETLFAQFWSKTFDDYFKAGATKYPAGASVSGDLRYHPLPYYLPVEDGPTATHPLFFTSWKEVEHTHTRTFNNAYLMEMKSESKLYVHPRLADKLGLAENDQAWVETPVSRIRVRIHRTEGIHNELASSADPLTPGIATVGFHRGFGHWALGKLAVGKGAHDGWILPGKAEIHSGQAVHKEVPCRIYKFEA